MRTTWFILAGIVVLALAACGGGVRHAVGETPGGVPAEPTAPRVDLPTEDTVDPGQPIRVLPPARAADPRRVGLGERLFADARLSGDQRLACATCHPLDRGGADGLVRSRMAGGREMPVNTPTVFNVASSFRYNWNGAYATLESELDDSVQRAMGTDWPSLVARVSEDDSYRADFASVYGRAVTATDIRDALATYERTLATPGARFDQWLAGDATAMTSEEHEGYEIFVSVGCASCHQGVAVGGNLFARMGVMGDYAAARGMPTQADLGRYNATLNPDDRGVFRVPSLRNVAATAPYLHDGSARTLDRAVVLMAEYQLGRTLTPTQVDRVVVFLRTLTGTWRGRLVGDPGR